MSKRLDLICADCLMFLEELEPEMVKPPTGFRVFGEYDKNIEYVGMAKCDDCEFGEEDFDDEEDW